MDALRFRVADEGERVSTVSRVEVLRDRGIDVSAANDVEDGLTVTSVILGIMESAAIRPDRYPRKQSCRTFW